MDDLISRQAAIEQSIVLRDISNPDKEWEVVTVATIKHLKSVQPEMKVLDKLRAELERRGGNDEKSFCKSLNESYKLGLREVIEIIDKYMAESEDKE